ncbi:MAG: hypothetical protein P4L90_07510 [Rhodopila sp.]|nr:hypothetical protein [Rhodopila sp.]
MGNPRSFLRTWIVTLASLAAVVVAVNLLVDPYDVFGTPRIAGISLLKPGAKNHALLAKTYQVARAHPVTVVIGSSSTHIGIDAFAPEWPAAMRPVYNYGIPGGYATSISLRTLQEAIAVGGVRNAVVFLDFQNFFVPEHPASGLTEDDRRYHTTPDGAPNPHRPLQVANDMFLSLATMGALIDSLSTVAGQGNRDLLNLAPDGSSTEADFIDAARADGMHDMFAQKDAFEAERAGEIARIMANWQGKLPNLDIVAAIIACARHHNVALALVITPHHGDALEIYWRNGLWPRVEQLKAELTALVAAQGGAVTLWDFLDYSTFNTESVPRAGDRRTPTHWFWEPTHFKKQLGEIMIQRMFGSDAPAFGALLTPNTIVARDAEIRADRQSLICERKAALLTAVETAGADGCAPPEKAPGPT